MQFTQGDKLPFIGYEDLLKKRRAEFEKEHPQKIEHEFQEVGIEMCTFFQLTKAQESKVWALFYKHDLKVIQDCFAICKKNNVQHINYFFGCLKRRTAGPR